MAMSTVLLREQTAMADWRKRLTKEQERRISAYQGELHPDTIVECWECRSIAQTLAGTE